MARHFFEGYLKINERDIHTAKKRVREAMNTALINMGVRNTTLQKRAVAGRIGKVIADHGETNCKTPDAAGYIQKILRWQKQRSAPARV